MIASCEFCKRAHCSHIVGRLRVFGCSLKMRKYLKIKNQTNVVTFATEEITHS